jgi:paired small multidrug resistance pump
MNTDALTALQWYDVVGLAGSAAILLGFFLLQAGRLRGTGLTYQMLNLFGALGVLVSLVGTFNLSVFLLEMAWVGVSAYGIVRTLRGRGDDVRKK